MRSRGAAVLAVGVTLLWLIAGAVTGPYAGKLGEVATNDNAAFLPAEAEATRAQNLAAGFVDRPTTAALVVYERDTGITGTDRQRAADDAGAFARLPGVVAPPPPPIPSDDGQALQVIVQIDAAEGEQIRGVVAQVREIAGTGSGGLAVHVAGPAGLLADLIEVFSSIDGPLLLVTLCVVLIILLIVYRSPVLWIIPLLAAGTSYAVAAFAAYHLADADLITLNGQAQGILTVLVFGAGTDYALLLIARYREELRHHRRTVDALTAAWRGAAPAILASGATVIVSLLCLLLSSLNSNRALGPVAAVGIAATLLVMLTFLPALLLLGGRWVFWPRSPQAGIAEPPGGMWPRIAGFVARRARAIWLATAALLVVLTLGLTQLGVTALGQSDLFTTQTDSVAGQAAMTRHYPGGLGSPVTIFSAVPGAERVAAVARSVPGVAQVQPVPAKGPATSTGPPGTPPGGPGTPPGGPGVAPGGSVTPPGGPGVAPGGPGVPGGGGPFVTPSGGSVGVPKVVNGRVQLQATLTAAPDSNAAEQTVRRLRVAVHAVPDAGAVVGGFTAINVDTSEASTRDRNRIIPVVLVVISAVLALLLRALLAPLLLILTVVLSFAATLGLCALLFRYVFDFPGVDASFPLFAFVFLVALGIDYNIFLMSRVREEAVKRGSRAGVLRGLVVTGGVITSAGVVLAATFSALAVLPLVVLIELGVAVALGVLLDTVVVRSLLVPALAYDLGPPLWWPGRLSRTNHSGRAGRHG